MEISVELFFFEPKMVINFFLQNLATYENRWLPIL